MRRANWHGLTGLCGVLVVFGGLLPVAVWSYSSAMRSGRPSVQTEAADREWILPVRIRFSMELQTYYRRFHRQSVEPLIPVVACVYGGVLLGKDLWLKGWIGYTMPLSAGSVPVYRVRTWYGGLGVEKVVVRSRWFGISSRLGLVGRTGALWFNTNPIIDAVPIYYEGIPDNYRIDALGLGMAVNLYLTPFRSKGTGLVFSYGLNKYLLGIGAHRYAFNETFGVVQVFFTIGNARSVSNPD